MRKNGKKLLSLALALVMVLAMLPGTAFAAYPTSGTCGDNVTWSMENGVLTISGTGEMTDYYLQWPPTPNAPWYYQREAITSVVINDGVTSIGTDAFYLCTSMTSVEIPDSVTSIGWNAFSSCRALTSVTIPSSVTSIGSDAFAGCSSLTSVTIPNSVTSIGDRAFSACRSLVEVTIPNSVTYIGSQAFSSTPWQENQGDWVIANSILLAYQGSDSSVIIPNNVTCIGYGAFEDCTSLTNVTISNSITSIRGYAFEGCTGLTSVTIPSSVTRIENGIFRDCIGLSSIQAETSSQSYVSVGGVLFTKDTKALVAYPSGKQGSYTIPNGVISIEIDAFSCSKALTGITIPSSVTSIKANAFYYCTGLVSVAIPSSVINIGNGAFFGCDGLNSVSLPNSVTSIGHGAFSGCKGLKDVYYDGSETQWRAIESDVPWANFGNDLTNATIHYNSTGPNTPSDGIAILSTEKSLTVQTGESMWLGFGRISHGQVVEDWKRMAIVVSDPSIISLSDYEETEYGYSIEVTGEKQGATNVVITDTESGQSIAVVITVRDSYVGTYSYAIDNIKTFYPNNKWENSLQTNIYDLNGIYVNNYQCSRDGTFYAISFDVYNSRYHTGAVDIYDANGNWIDCEEITKFGMTSSLWDTGEQAWHLISDAVTGKLLTYEQASFSKHSPISIKVPVGGYFTISNNFAESPGTFLFNSCDIFYDGILTLIDAGLNKMEPSAFSGLIKEKITENTTVRETFISIFKNTVEKEVRSYTKRALNGEVDVLCSNISGQLENILSSLGINWKHLFKTATGISESAFAKFAGPAGIALKGCFALAKGSNQLVQVIHLARSVDVPYATVFSAMDEGSINSHGVIVNTNGNVDAETELHVFKVSNNTTIEDALNGSGDDQLKKYELYNICFVKKDQLIQPNGKVTVRVPIPTGMRADTCKVYRQENDGTWTILTAHIEGNYLAFETDHFSLYGIVGVANELGVSSLPNKMTYNLGDVLNLDGLVLSLGNSLITEGFICEPMVLAQAGAQRITVQYGIASTEFTVSVQAANTPDGNSVFTDVPSGSWYYDAVQWAVEQGITNGTGTATFSPNNSCTRAQMATFLWRAAGSPKPKGSTNPFTDVQPGTYYYDAVLWAVEQGITNGTSATTFSPDTIVTRAQTVTFLYRTANSPAVSGNNPFTDVPAGMYYSYAVQWAVGKGITNGTSATTFSPDADCTRGQIVTFLYRAMAE